MNVQLLKDNKKASEMWFKFTYKNDNYLICVATTDKPFRGVSDIKAIYREDNQNKMADLPDSVVSNVYAEVLDESVNHL